MATDPLSSVVYRRAKPEDHREVLNILDNVYEGLDYLDWAFPFYITQSTIRCFVAEKDGKVVSLGGVSERGGGATFNRIRFENGF